MEKLRLEEHDVTLKNQAIIEMAYVTRDLILPLIKERRKLSFEAANNYQSSFNHCRKLLQIVPTEYLTKHTALIEFYTEKRELSNQWDRLSWVSPKDDMADIVIKYDVVPSDGPCGICGEYTKNQPGPGLYVEGSWEPVCYECAVTNCRALMRLLERDECRKAFP